MSKRPTLPITDKDPSRIDALRKRVNDDVMRDKLAGNDKCTQVEMIEKWGEAYERENSPNNKYDPNYGDARICECGHSYYRHFDSWEDMAPVGCKYCGCTEFKEAQSIYPINPNSIPAGDEKEVDDGKVRCKECGRVKRFKECFIGGICYSCERKKLFKKEGGR